MAEFSVNTHRFDPYKNFKFRIRMDGRYVAGVSKVSGLKRHTEVIEWRQGGEPSMTRKMPGFTTYDPITLERGVTHDPDFEDWANKVWPYITAGSCDFNFGSTCTDYSPQGGVSGASPELPAAGLRTKESVCED